MYPIGMEHKAVTLMIRYRGADGKWRRSPAARRGNGRVEPGHALVDKKALPVMGGYYELRMYENRRLIYVNAGKNAATADAHRTRLEVTRSAKAVAKDAGFTPLLQGTAGVDALILEARAGASG